MRIILFLTLNLMVSTSWGQVPEDAIRYSWYPSFGTARMNAIGGASGSVGGDISTIFSNPAGLAIFHTQEAVLSFGISQRSGEAIYRDSLGKASHLPFNMAPTGWVFSAGHKDKPKANSAFGIAFHQLASFNNILSYSSLNNYSSFAETFAESFAGSGYSINDVLTSNSPMPYTAAPALYTYLIDTLSTNGITRIKAAPEYVLDAGGALRQTMDKRTRGGLHELGIGFAHTDNDQWLFGATLGIPIAYFHSRTNFSEYDTSANRLNRFQSFTFQDDFTSTGSGLNLKLGTIYRPTQYVRLGVSFHSPGFMSFNETRTTSISTVLESDSGTVETFQVNSNSFSNNAPGEYKYIQIMPMKAIISASYVFRETENVHRQRAFISGDIEFVNHHGTKFISDNEFVSDAEKAYYKDLTQAVRNNYKGAFNFRLGGELKYDVIMGRLGFAYYMSPYKETAFKSGQMLLCGGLGYRDKGYFVDLTYTYIKKKDIDFPYRLQDRASGYATVKNISNMFSLTCGVKF